MQPVFDVLFTPPAAAVLGALVGLGYLAHKVAPAIRKFGHFLDDWGGEPARGPVPARPGVLERLHAIETDVGQLKDDVADLRGDRIP